MQLVFHLQRGEADVDAVEVGDNVEEKKERDEAPGQLGNDGRFEGVCGVCGDGRVWQKAAPEGTRILRQRKLCANFTDDYFWRWSDVDDEGVGGFFEGGELTG